jgi:mRNA interferase MazF
VGSVPGYRRPVVVVQCDALNTSRIGTVVCVPLTSNLKWERAPGRQLVERVGKIPRRQLELVLSGIDVIVGR